MIFGDRLRTLRQEAGLVQNDVALRTGLSMPYISDLERCKVNPSLDTVVKLARAFNLSVLEFLAPLDFTGDSTPAGLPEGVKALEACPVFGPELSDEWLTLLGRLEHNGQRLRTKEDATEIYLHLKRLLEAE